MSLILNIDTSTEMASICLSEKEKCLLLLSNAEQKDHAAWLHPAIEQVLMKTGKNLHDLQAIGITAGPGSFTGLRVAMATAKGLCYALTIPLIAVNTLEAMASAVLEEDTDYICPMIDARRMEVFTAVYDKSLAPIIAPCAMILDQNSFFELLGTKKILFLGNGKNKWERLVHTNNAVFRNIPFNASQLSLLTFARFVTSAFQPLAYIEPVYLKDYFSPISRYA